MRLAYRTVALASIVTLTACQTPNDIALKVGAQPTDAAALRTAEITTITAPDPATILRAGTATLQDLGFTVTESSTAAGVLAGTKARDATTTGGVAGAIVMGILFGAAAVRYDKSQQINVTFVVAPATTTGEFQTRVSFDRYLTNNQNQLWRTELVTDPKIYQQFHEDLNKAMTLDTQAKS